MWLMRGRGELVVMGLRGRFESVGTGQGWGWE